MCVCVCVCVCVYPGGGGGLVLRRGYALEYLVVNRIVVKRV